MNWSKSTNFDGSKNLGLSIGTGQGLNGNGFVGGYKDLQPGLMNQNKYNYEAIGGGLSLNSEKGHAIGLSGAHMPAFGNSLTASAKVNVLTTDSHKVDANAFATKTFPHHPGMPSAVTHGGSVNYQFKDKLGAEVGMSNTAGMGFQEKQYNALGSVNLHKTPNSSLDLNMGASKTVSPFDNGLWQPSASIGFRKNF